MKKIKQRIVSNEPNYLRTSVYLDVVKDLRIVESLDKNHKVTEDEKIAANSELRLKWQPVEEEITAYLASKNSAARLKNKQALLNKLKLLHDQKIIEKSTQDTAEPKEKPKKKTLKAKKKERAQKQKDRQTARQARRKEKKQKVDSL
jgi:hypothetical protein